MIGPQSFLDALHETGIRFFTGVPDSLMKGFLACVQEKEKEHIITANEGAAVAMASGYHLATGKTGLVYLQNSGLGNLINPLTSLANREVYGFPMLLMIGWRGQPGKKDEPQHQKMGVSTIKLLEVLEIPFFVFNKDCDWQKQLREAVFLANEKSQPVALVIEDGFFQDTGLVARNDNQLSAADIIEAFYPSLDHDAVVVCTTGKIGRLFYSINRQHQNRIGQFFLNVGAMGHASSIAAALARYSQRKIVLLDGDGALLMHMGSLAVIGGMKLKNLHYYLLNNGAHQSVGGQPTAAFEIDCCAIAKACGFENTQLIITKKDMDQWLSLEDKSGFTEFRINTQMPEQLPRPEEHFTAAKEKLMNLLEKGRI
jgi:phosphonopyruvate decarboxylase